MNSYKTGEMVPVHFIHEASATSVDGSRRGLKRGRFSSEYTTSSANKPRVKKARPPNQRYPGGHIEVWHSSEVAPVHPKESLYGTSVQADATAEHQIALQLQLQLQPPIPLTPDRCLSTTHETSGTTTVPIYSGQPSYAATYSEQWLPEPVISQDSFSLCSPSATNLSLSACIFPPSTTSSSTAHEKWADICSESLSSETWTEINPAVRALLQTQDFEGPGQTEDVDLYNSLFQTYADPISYLAELPYADFCYFPWTAPNDLTMGGGEHFPTPQLEQAAFSDCEPVHGPGECWQLSLHEPWPAQELGPTFTPNFPPPVQPLLQDTMNDCTSPPQTLEQDGLHHNEAPNEGQMSHKDLLVLSPRQKSPDPQPELSRAAEEEVLTVSEDSQDTGEGCTCETESPNTCSFCVNSPQSWVMVTYKLAKPPGKERTEKKPPRPRRPLEEDARRQTSQTRDIGACVRCKIQRIRCVPNSEEPSGPCKGCFQVALNTSRKVLHHIGCYRYKLQEVVLFRTSGSRVTDRWHSAQVRNVLTEGKTLSVQIMQDCVNVPFTCQIRKISGTGRSSHNDKTMREWWDGKDVQKQPVAEYALADVYKTLAQYKEYIRDSVLGNNAIGQPAIFKVVKGFRETSHSTRTELVGDVFQKAWDHFRSLPNVNAAWDFYQPWPPGKTQEKTQGETQGESQGETQGETKGKPQPKKTETARLVSEKEFLLGLFELRFALRHACGWSWILEQGIPKDLMAEDPGFQPLQFPPLRDLIGTPRIVVGQIDCLRISYILKPLTKSLLKVLMAWIADRQYDRWMTIFFATFILLSELAKSTEDAYHHGFYDKDIKGSGPKNAHVIRDIHESANIILAHWHYYNCSTDPSDFSEKQSTRRKTPLRALTAEQFAIVRDLWERIRQWKQRQNDVEPYDNKDKETEGWWKKWCHSMYFADQMIDKDWTPRHVFS